jgi:hypothetical protein
MRRLRALGCAVINEAALLESTVTSWWPGSGARVQPGPGAPDEGGPLGRGREMAPGLGGHGCGARGAERERWCHQRHATNRPQTTDASPIDATEI